MTKKCTTCGKELPIALFAKGKTGKYGVRSYCKSCHSERNRTWYSLNQTRCIERNTNYRRLHKKPTRTRRRFATKEEARQQTLIYNKQWRVRKTFNLSVEEYDTLTATLFREQGGKCAICQRQAASYNKHPKDDPNTLHLDHDHVSMKLRQLLCWHCNKALGAMNDSSETLRKAANYLDYHAVTSVNSGK